VTVDDINGVQIQFNSNSGVYPISGAMPNIATFVSNWWTGNLSAPNAFPPAPAIQQSPPDVVVRVPCYVVIELNSLLQLNFSRGHPGMKVSQSVVGAYDGLMHVGSTSGTPTANSAPTNEDCRLIYFAAVSPLPTSQGVGDPFNLYVEYNQGSSFGRPISITIDPDIKNDGGSSGLTGSGGP
jgi:hypothetical protein